MLGPSSWLGVDRRLARKKNEGGNEKERGGIVNTQGALSKGCSKGRRRKWEAEGSQAWEGWVGLGAYIISSGSDRK